MRRLVTLTALFVSVVAHAGDRIAIVVRGGVLSGCETKLTARELKSELREIQKKNPGDLVGSQAPFDSD